MEMREALFQAGLDHSLHSSHSFWIGTTLSAAHNQAGMEGSTVNALS